MPLTRSRPPKTAPAAPAPSEASQDVRATLAPSRTQLKARRRPALAAGGVALIALGGLASAYVVAQTQTQNDVVMVRANVARGEQIEASDLSTTTVGSLSNLSSVPAAQITQLVGQRALVDLKAGSLLPQSAIGTQPQPADGRSIIGMSLAPGRVMNGTITPGSKLRLVVLPADSSATSTTTDNQTGQVFEAVMVSTAANTLQGSGELINVEVAEDQAPLIGTMAAANRIVVIKDSDQ